MFKDCTDDYPKEIQTAEEIAEAWEQLEYNPVRQNKHDKILSDLKYSVIHLAYYNSVGYDGQAQVIYEKNGKLYECQGSHCSCYGLEDQWSPDEVTWEAIAMRESDDAQLAKRMIDARN